MTDMTDERISRISVEIATNMTNHDRGPSWYWVDSDGAEYLADFGHQGMGSHPCQVLVSPDHPIERLEQRISTALTTWDAIR